jgi:beta-lactamase superfamily II metal-dependent hydrolase
MTATLKTAFAVYPSVKLKGMKPDPKTKKMKWGILKELLFGDWIRPYSNTSGSYVTKTVTEGKNKVKYIKVRARGVDGYIKEEQMQKDRPLEVNFVDVGQGDGCHIVMPDDKHFLIDAGPADNMYRFLKWRFNLKNAKAAPPPFTVIVSHSDSDHYKGFGKIFSATKGAAQQFTIDKIYHNGLVELSGKSVSTLGMALPNAKKPTHIAGLCDTDTAYKKRAASVDKPGLFVNTMNKSAAPKQSLKKGSQPLYNKNNILMEVLGPVTERVNGKEALPVFADNKGKTKNGHSVVLKLTIGNLRMLLGGDLNTPAENYLLNHYSNIDVADIKEKLRDKNLSAATRKTLEAKLEKAVMTARKTFQVDIAKSCHHGSADFTTEFMRALNPLATVISSGDNEPHTHPRPDTLGTIGKHSRGVRSLIFSTELARSAKEFVEIGTSKKTTKKPDSKGNYEKIKKEQLPFTA